MRRKTQESYNAVKQEAKEMTVMKQVAASLAKLTGDSSRLKAEIAALEKSLSNTGSSKTADDVQEELGALSDKMCVPLFFHDSMIMTAYIVVPLIARRLATQMIAISSEISLGGTRTSYMSFNSGSRS